MARGKYLSLEEARKQGRLDRFCKEHPSVGDEKLFDRLLDAMAHGEPPSPRRKAKGARTSSRGDGANCTETQTRRGT